MALCNDLPLDVVKLIIKKAELDIDTRVKLRVKPGKIKNNIEMVTNLQDIHNRRAKSWLLHERCRKQMDGSGAALDYFKSPPIDVHTYISFGIWYLDDEVRISIEKNEVNEIEQELYCVCAEYFIMHSGVPCSKLFDDDEVGDDF